MSNELFEEESEIKKEEVNKLLELIRQKLIVAAYYENDIYDENLLKDLKFVKVDLDREEIVFRASMAYANNFDQKIFSFKLHLSSNDSKKMAKMWSEIVPGYENEKEITYDVKTKIKKIKNKKKKTVIEIRYGKGEKIYDKIKKEITIHYKNKKKKTEEKE